MFDSFYQKHTLKEYNASLDIRLFTPVSRFTGVLDCSVEQLIKQLIEVHKLFLDDNEKSEQYLENSIKYTNKIKDKTLAQEAHTAMIQMFAEHVGLNKSLERESQEHEKITMAEHRVSIEVKVKEMEAARDDVDRELRQARSALKQVERELSELKPRMSDLQRQREIIIRQLQGKKMSDESINSILNPNNLPEPSDYVVVDRERQINFNDRRLWFINTGGRDRAAQLLSGKPDGTFLIRNSSNSPDCPYALSIVADSRLQHCLIRMANDLYGFADPYILHKTLEDLVVNYSTVSLEEHNDMLRTPLKYPVFTEPPPEE